MLVSIVTHFSDGGVAVVSLIKSAAYNAVTLLWVMYLRRPSDAISVVDVDRQVDDLAGALVPSIQPTDYAFLSMVEQAVDRVLSRGSWPKPSVRGSQVIGRKPEREERN